MVGGAALNGQRDVFLAFLSASSLNLASISLTFMPPDA
jgi:hypothetical protein